MSEEIRVGDRALTYFSHQEIEVVAVDGEWCFCHYIGEDDYLATRSKFLTRTEPDAPQPSVPLFSIGQRVQNTDGRFGKVLSEVYVEVEDDGITCYSPPRTALWRPGDIKPAPAVCQHCGQELPDG